MIYALNIIKNTTANVTHAWVNPDGSLQAYWSPPYWSELVNDEGLGYYWNSGTWN